MNRWPRLAALILLLASCAPDKPVVSAPASSPAHLPVNDKPPYLCYFIPQGEVAQLSGYMGAFKAGSDKRDPEGYSCVVSNDERSIFITRYDVSARQQNLNTFTGNGKRSSPVELPPELGKGQIHDFEARLYPFRLGGVWFQCGATSPFISIAVMKNPARDQDYDLVQLLKIAQRRYGEMFDCSPSPTPK